MRFVCFTILLLANQILEAEQNGFVDADAIQAFLRANFGNTSVGMVIGLVDERGSRVLAAGKLDNGTGLEVNGDTVFEIGSVTKTFTTLLLVDMMEQGGSEGALEIFQRFKTQRIYIVSRAEVVSCRFRVY